MSNTAGPGSHAACGLRRCSGQVLDPARLPANTCRRNSTTQVALEACKQICGRGAQERERHDVTATIISCGTRAPHLCIGRMAHRTGRLRYARLLQLALLIWCTLAASGAR